MIKNKFISLILTVFVGLSAVSVFGCGDNKTKTQVESDGLVLSYSFDETSGSTTYDKANNKNTKIHYVFNSENQSTLFKPSNDPLRKAGVGGRGKSLYMDGFSTYLEDSAFATPENAFTLSAWVAPRVFENLVNYGGDTEARNNPRLTAVISQGNT